MFWNGHGWRHFNSDDRWVLSRLLDGERLMVASIGYCICGKRISANTMFKLRSARILVRKDSGGYGFYIIRSFYFKLWNRLQTLGDMVKPPTVAQIKEGEKIYKDCKYRVIDGVEYMIMEVEE